LRFSATEKRTEPYALKEKKKNTTLLSWAALSGKRTGVARIPKKKAEKKTENTILNPQKRGSTGATSMQGQSLLAEKGKMTVSRRESHKKFVESPGAPKVSCQATAEGVGGRY